MAHEWINKGMHLPYWLRDFHDQKDVFKSVERHMGRDRDAYAVPWMNGHCYVIDRFLRYMALHGYTLQKTHRKGIQIADIHKTLDRDRQEDAEAFKKMLDEVCQQPAPATGEVGK